MSRYSGNGEKCPTCALTYGEFRTGFTWEDIWLMYWTAEDAPRDEWKRKSRGVILGKWFEIKKSMWEHHIEECKMDWKREVTMTPAYDMRDKNCGVHGVELRMYLSRNQRTVQFIVFTNWHWLETPPLLRQLGPTPADVGYHSPTPWYEGQEVIDDDCPYTGGACYYDGSGLQAEDVFKILLREGIDGVWKDLESRWMAQFEEFA